MTPELSHRATQIFQSEIRAMSIECERAKGINLAQGVCDTEVPLSVRRAAQSAIESGANTYTRFDGIAELRTSIARKLLNHNLIEADPESQIIVSAGSTGALYCACLALLNPGDEVILFEPYYGYHENTIWSVGAKPVYVSLRPPDWSFSAEDIKANISLRTKALVVNTPSNPAGKVFSARELAVIADLVLEHNLFLLTDEIYEYFLYGGRKHISPATLPGMADRTITISGFSKTFSITGWRIGYSVSDPRWAQMIGYMNDLIYVCAPSPLQHGVASGIDKIDEDFYRSLKLEYTTKRDLLCSSLTKAGLTPFVPDGAYYVLSDVSRLPGNNSKDKAMYLLNKTGVASVPGEAFFRNGRGKNFVRFCFAKPESHLREACRRLELL